MTLAKGNLGTNPAYIEGTTGKIDVDKITFETLKRAHLAIQAWSEKVKARDIAQDRVLNDPRNDGETAQDFIEAIRELEDAKTQMLKKLEDNLSKTSSLNSVKPKDVAAKRNEFCGSTEWKNG